jgi:hypothetical protein
MRKNFKIILRSDANAKNLKKILRSDAKFCEFSHNAIFRKMRIFACEFFAKCDFSHANFREMRISQNANFRMRFFRKMRISNAIFACEFLKAIIACKVLQKLVTSWPKTSHPVTKKISKKNRKIYLQESHYPSILTFIQWNKCSTGCKLGWGKKIFIP